MPEPLAARIRDYLAGHGWTESGAGPAGTLWTPPGRQRGVPLQVLVTQDIAPGCSEWSWIIRRIAELEDRPPAVITAEILDLELLLIFCRIKTLVA